jgi:hypothetical protein
MVIAPEQGPQNTETSSPGTARPGRPSLSSSPELQERLGLLPEGGKEAQTE